MTRAPASLLASLGLCVLGGLALSLAFPPAGLWPVAFVALTPLLWTLRAAGPARGALLGLAYGAAFFGATLSWIALFGELAWTALVLLSAASTALFGVLATAMLRPGHPWRSAAGVAALWTAGELLRGSWPLGGFTWGTLGVSQVDDRWLLPLASVTGIAGVTFVVVAANALLVEAAVGGGGARRSVAHLAVAVALVAAPVAIGFPTADGPQLNVATIQVDVRLAEDPSVANEDLEVARLHVEAHAALAADPPDVALWGEGSLDPEATADPATAEAVRRAIADVGVPTIVGAVVDDADGGQRTSVLAFDGGARLVDRYDKVHLVPFGEYVPFRDRLGWVEAIRQIPVDRVAGDAIGVLDVPGIPPVATPICFENSFPGLPRDAVNAGAEILIVPVNNASYGFTAAAEQHLQMSRARAVETGRWVVNAAISGISAFIEPSGAVVSRTDLFATDILRGTVRSSDARTPFVRLGDWFSWCSVVIAAGLFLAPRRRASTRPPTDPSAVRPRILVIVPTYDERATIADVVRGVLDRDDDVSVLVVDDASPDGTAEVVRAIAATDPRVRLLEREAKGGLAGAYLAGFRIALEEGYDLVVEMDADLSHEPADLGRLLLGATRHDVTIGSRYVPGGSVTNWSRLRLALSKGGNAYARFMLGLPIRDATSGYRVFRREVLERLLERPIAADGYGFQVELVLRAWRLGYDVGEVPITFREREHGHSKISRRIVVEALWLFTWWGLTARFGSRGAEPERVASG